MRDLCFNCPYNKGLELGNGCGNDTCIQENMLFEKDEEKERYELREKIYDMSNSFLPLDKFYNDIESMAILSSFDEEFAFKDLEKIADFILDLQKQLHDLPKKIVEDMKEFGEPMPYKQGNKPYMWIIGISDLQKILKKYGGENEINND